MFPRPALASHIVVYVTESFNVAWILFHVSVQILIFTKIDFVILGMGLSLLLNKCDMIYAWQCVP